jgi:hypothetical protein
MAYPLIQIDDEIREMTEEEYETYLASQGQGTPIHEEGTATDEVPASDDAGALSTDAG